MKFSDVIGNSGAVERLRNLIDSDRVPHALLLHGDVGVPKLALAQAAIQYLHCTNRRNGDSCGECPSCIQHQSFNHADTFFSYPVVKLKSSDNTTSVDYIEQWRQFLSESIVEDYERWLTLLNKENAQPIIYASESDSIIRQMSYASYSSKYKVLLMWLPEKMNEACANKLLKMIEEPDPDSIFILVSNNAKEILPTIYSRTQRIELRKPSTDEIAAYIANQFEVDYQDALAVAAPADGNVAMAVNSMRLDSENKAFLEQFKQLMRLAYMRDLKGLKAWSETIADFKREKSSRFLDYAARMVRENFIYNIRSSQLNYLTHDEEQFSSKFSPFINEANVERMVEELTRAKLDIQQNANSKIVLFDLAVLITILIKR